MRFFNSSKTTVLIPLFVLLIGLAATYSLQQSALDSERRLQQEKFAFNTHEIKQRIEQKLAAYEIILHGATGLFTGSEHVNRAEFHEYVAVLQLKKHYPGIQGIAFSPIVPADKIANHVDSIRKTEFPDYTIHPAGKRDAYTPIIYLEPLNRRALGYDAYAEPARRATMEWARDLDESVMTGKLLLTQKKAQQNAIGFILYMPVYLNNSAHNTIAERRANIIGWISSPFRIDDLMRGMLADQTKEVMLSMYDGNSASPENLMYTSPGKLMPVFGDLPHSIQTIKFANHLWTINIRTLRRLDTTQATTIQLSGILMSLLLSLFVWQLLSGRTRAFNLAHDMTRDLSISEDRFRKLVKFLPISLSYVTEKGAIQNLNNRFTQTFGYTLDDIPTLDKWWQHAYPDNNDREHAIKTWNNAVSAASTSSLDIQPVEYNIRCKNNSVRAIEVSGVTLGNDVLTTYIDITERKQAEIMLRANENQLAAIYSNVNSIVFVINVTHGDQFRFVSVNRKFLETTQLTRDLVIGKLVQEVMPEPGCSIAIEKYQEALKEHKSIQWEETSIYPSGKKIAEVNVVPVFNVYENCMQLIGMVHDITEYKLTEKALLESEEKYRLLFELSEDPMWLILDDKFVMANQASAQLLGYKTTLTEIHPAEVSPEFQPDGQPSFDKSNIMMSIAYREGYHRFEWLHKKKNGETLPTEVSLTRIPYQGRDALFCIARY